MVTMDATNGDRPESSPFPLPSGRRHPPGLEKIYSCPVSGSHAPLQNVQSDSIGYIPKRKACIVKLDGCRFTIGRYLLYEFLNYHPISFFSVYWKSYNFSCLLPTGFKDSPIAIEYIEYHKETSLGGSLHWIAKWRNNFAMTFRP